jgi:hypothetical protein
MNLKKLGRALKMALQESFFAFIPETHGKAVFEKKPKA